MELKDYSEEDLNKEIASRKNNFLNNAWKARINFKLGIGRRVDLSVQEDRKFHENEILWLDAIIKVCGNIKVEWKYNNKTSGYDCHLETGEVFYWENIKM